MEYTELLEILEIGTRAVSTCNNQPWRFRFHDQILDIFILRTKNFFLKLEGNTWIELGTVLENISVASASKGYRIEYQLFERCGLDEQAATVKFIPEKIAPVDLEPLLNRCTNREPYSQQLLPKSVTETILKACDVPDIKIHILKGSQKVQCAKILNDLENILLGNLLLIQEALPYVRVNEQDIEAYRDLLDVRTLDLSPNTISLVKLAKKYPKLHSSLFLFFVYLGILPKNKLKKTLSQSGALLAFSISRRDQENYVNLGRITQRVLNYLISQNIQTCTMVSGLYLLDLLTENLEIYSSKEQVALLRAQHDLQSFFNFTDRRIALFIRAGYGTPPKFRSLRKNIADFMLDEYGNIPEHS